MSNKDLDMSFLDHLEVLRWHLIRSGIAIISLSILAFICKDFIFDTVLLAPKDPDFFTYKFLCNISQSLGIGDALCIKESPFSLMNITMSGQFSTHLMTSLYAGFILSFPYVFWEIWRFIVPALKDSETKVTRGVVFFSSFLFLTGVLFGYYVIAPLSINFLGSYQVSQTVANQISLTSFVTTVTTVSLANGIIFELPILVYFLTKIGFLTPEFMRAYRKHAMVITLILSAIITPPDITSQILVSFPLIILYEISIRISRAVIKRNNL
jgi:sec-independent protein translocase protein TatC